MPYVFLKWQETWTTPLIAEHLCLLFTQKETCSTCSIKKNTLFFFQENGLFSAFLLSYVQLFPFNFLLHLELISISLAFIMWITHLNFS